MSAYRWLVLAVVSMLTGCAHSLGAMGCLEPAQTAGTIKSDIALPTEIKEPFFYYRSMSFHHAFAITPPGLVAALESAGSQKEAKELLEMIRQDLPLSSNADLLRYTFRDPYLFSLIQRIFADELDAFRVGVLYLPIGTWIPRVEVARQASDRMRSRTYTAGGDTLIESLDCIVD